VADAAIVHPGIGLPLMAATDANVYRVHLADPGGRVTIRELPTDSFETTERGIVAGATMVIPWHRVLRYTREVVRPLEESGLPTHTEIHAWVDDGSESGERLRVRTDRFETGPWTADLLVERVVNVETATIHLTKVHVPWGRVYEYERTFLPADAVAPTPPG
jgi:uncharacterized protein (UPF0248 family)